MYLYTEHIMKQLIKRTITAIILGLCFWLSFIYLPPIYFSLILLAILVHIIVVEWRNFFKTTDPSYWLIMPFYPIVPFALLIYMNMHPCYHNLLFVLFILVSSHDMGSYLVGNIIGRHKISPSISPGKTWEGFFGGFVFASIGLTLLLWEQGTLQPWWFILGFSFIVCVLALLGDLFESYLKRRAGIKDSGDALPGHGGFLDRFDGILFAVFFFFFFKSWLVRIFC